MPAKVLGPSEHGADYQTITYERAGTVVMHDFGPIAWMSIIRVPTGCNTVHRTFAILSMCLNRAIRHGTAI